MNPIIAIEGVSFAGKTTITKQLEKDGFFRLYELADKFEHGKGFPSFANNTEEANASDAWFLEQEILREIDAVRHSKDFTVFADRSFLSGLAYNYARHQIFCIGNPQEYKKALLKALAESKIHIPWFVYLKADINTILDRKKIDNINRLAKFGEEAVKNVTIPENEVEFFVKLIEFYDEFFSFFPHLKIDARKSPDEIVEIVKDWIKNIDSQFNNTKNLFNDYEFQ